MNAAKAAMTASTAAHATEPARPPLKARGPGSRGAFWPTIEAASIFRCACGGGCPRCRDNEEDFSQRLLGSPNDVYEQEAERLADTVVRLPDKAVHEGHMQRTYAGHEEDLRRHPLAESERGEEKAVEVEIQRRLAGGGAGSGDVPGVRSSVDLDIRALKGGGKPLPQSARAFFEPRFGMDLSAVRVHTGDRAAESARVVNARAYTIGTDIVFAPGEFAPEADGGKRLLAHELTHVIQQQGAPATRADSNQDSILAGEAGRWNGHLRHSSVVLDHLHALKHRDNTDSTSYRPEIRRLLADSGPRIRNKQQHILGTAHDGPVRVRRADRSGKLRRCIAGCNPTPQPKTFDAGDTLAVDSKNREGWIRGRIGSDIVSFPDFLKVDYVERRGGRDHFRIAEGPYRGQQASLLVGYLEDGQTWKGPASVVFKEESSRSTAYQSQGRVETGAVSAEAKLFVNPDTAKIAADREYPLQLPDSPHAGGAAYGDYAKTWFRIEGGPQGDEYLHRGARSAGCVTVTEDVWPAIYHHLIDRREGNRHIGKIKRVII